MPGAREVLTPDALAMLQTVAERGSFAAAARALGVVPSALTYRVRQIEDALDVLLFDRSARQARLTEAGAELLRDAGRLLAEIDAVANRVRRIATGWEPQLTIAIDSAIARDPLYDLVGAFYALNPPTRLKLRDETLLGTIEALTSGEADLAIGADGIWSKVRQALGLEQVHEQSLEGALRTMIPAREGDIPAADSSKYIENWNGTRRLLITPVNKNITYLALTCPHTDDKARNTVVDKKLWSADFPQWAHLIERIGPEVSWGVYSVIKCRAWSSGRTVILGDAAHAQPPNLGQGGGMAMQNGLALATVLQNVSTQQAIPDALEQWEHNERDIVEHCQKWSTLYGEVTFLPDDVRSMVIRNAMANPWVASQIFRAANHTPTGSERVPAAA